MPYVTLGKAQRNAGFCCESQSQTQRGPWIFTGPPSTQPYPSNEWNQIIRSLLYQEKNNKFYTMDRGKTFQDSIRDHRKNLYNQAPGEKKVYQKYLEDMSGKSGQAK